MPAPGSDVLKSFGIVERFAFIALCRLVGDDPTVIDDESARACDANASRCPRYVSSEAVRLSPDSVRHRGWSRRVSSFDPGTDHPRCLRPTQPPIRTVLRSSDRAAASSQTRYRARSRNSCSDTCRRRHRYQRVQDLPWKTSFGRRSVTTALLLCGNPITADSLGVRPQSLPKGVGVSEITSPRELFLHELGDILYVERKLADEVLPRLITEVGDEEFKSTLKTHLEQTKQHVSNVENVFQILDEEPHEEECIGFEGLKKEHDELLQQASSSLIDSIDLGAAARTENYEIAAYEGLRRMAKGLGENDAVALLDENLAQEKEALREVEKITTRLSNEMFAGTASS